MKPLKIVSFNVNGIRVRLHQLAALIDKHHPEIIALQETKVQDVDFPVEEIEELGYRAIWFGQKTHYGVALLHRLEPVAVQYGFSDDGPEMQKRLIAATYPSADRRPLRVINGYFPQGESREHPVKFPHKARFYTALQEHLRMHEDTGALLVVLGDMNVAPTDRDIGIGEENARRWLRTGKCSFLPEEREWLQQLTGWGLTDSFRVVHPDCDDRFSWFDYRSRGFEREPRRGLRIDLILTSRALQAQCVDAGIDYEIRAMERPSDHAPVWAEFALDV
jgi:exodeoxyribonuclease-3